MSEIRGKDVLRIGAANDFVNVLLHIDHVSAYLSLPATGLVVA